MAYSDGVDNGFGLTQDAYGNWVPVKSTAPLQGSSPTVQAPDTGTGNQRLGALTPDPNAVLGAATTAPGPSNPNGSTAPKGPVAADKSNDIKLQNAALDSNEAQRTSGIAGVEKSLGSILGGYATERTANEGNYNTQSDTNQNNLQKNKQSALIGAAQGRKGLFGTLASLGALNGDGLTLANNAVQEGANEDLAGAADSFGNNQSGLDTSIGTFRSEDDARQKRAREAADNAKVGVENQAAKQKQGYYTSLSNDYSEQLDKGNAAKYADLAAALYPDIARTSIPGLNLAPEAAAFTPASLSSYLANANNTQVSSAPTPGGVGINGLPSLFATDKKKVTA